MLASGLPYVSGGHSSPVRAPLSVRNVPWPAGRMHSSGDAARGPAVVMVPLAASHGVHGWRLKPRLYCGGGCGCEGGWLERATQACAFALPSRQH